MKALKEIYGWSYDTSGFGSGLITWYNRLLDKTYDDLTIEDVCRMIRQDMAKDIAVQKAIEFFVKAPYGGEYYDGELLNTLISLDTSLLSVSDVDKIKDVLDGVKYDYVNFEWTDEESKKQYAQNINKMIEKLDS